MCAVGQDQQTRIGVGADSIGAGLGGSGVGGAGSSFIGSPEGGPETAKQGWTRNAVLVGTKETRVAEGTPGAQRRARQGGRDNNDPSNPNYDYYASQKLYK